MKMIINGELIETESATISVLDHGFMYGMGLFETFKTYSGKPWLLRRHMDRLESGCRLLQLEWERDDERTEYEISRILKENQWKDAYFRYTVSAGNGNIGLPYEPYKKPNILIYAKPLPEINSFLYQKGKPLQRLATRRNTPETMVRLKSLHYMNNIAAKQELRSYTWAHQAEGLLMTPEGFLAEGIVSNLFFVKKNKLFTPSEETGILRGITRDYVIEIWESMNGSCCTGKYTWDDLLAADEIFITNSIQELVPITTLYEEDGKACTVAEGLAGKITKLLTEAYRTQIRRMIKA